MSSACFEEQHSHLTRYFGRTRCLASLAHHPPRQKSSSIPSLGKILLYIESLLSSRTGLIGIALLSCSLPLIIQDFQLGLYFLSYDYDIFNLCFNCDILVACRG